MSPDTVTVEIAQCPSLATIVDFREIQSTPTPTPTNIPAATPTNTPTAAPELSIRIDNVVSATSVPIGETYWYTVTVTNTSPDASLTRIVLYDYYNTTNKQCVVTTSANHPDCRDNNLLKRYQCDIQTTIIPYNSITIRFGYMALNICTSTQNANTATAIGYNGASSSPPVSASAYVEITTGRTKSSATYLDFSGPPVIYRR